MQDRRKPAHETTPEYEDSGIFKNPPTELIVELVPKFGKNSRLDIMVKGFVQSEVPIDVVFAGRRKAQAEPLLHRLRALWGKANRQCGKNDPAPEVDEVRLPVRIEGSWRPRFARDDQGWQTRTYQLFASRWLLVDEAGETTTYGEPPIRTQVAKAPAPQTQPALKRSSQRR